MLSPGTQHAGLGPRAFMDDERPLQDTLQEEYESECCPHGIHPDSGHVCLECLVNEGDEDAE